MPPKKDGKVRSSKNKRQSENDSSSNVVASTSVSFEQNSIFLPAALDCGGDQRQKGKVVKKQSDFSKSSLVSCVMIKNQQGIVDNKESIVITPAPYSDHCYITSSCVEDLVLAEQNVVPEKREQRISLPSLPDSISLPTEAVNSSASKPAGLVKGKSLANPFKGKSITNLGSAVSLTIWSLSREIF
jgi:hypothetical protein